MKTLTVVGCLVSLFATVLVQSSAHAGWEINELYTVYPQNYSYEHDDGGVNATNGSSTGSTVSDFGTNRGDAFFHWNPGVEFQPPQAHWFTVNWSWTAGSLSVTHGLSGGGTAAVTFEYDGTSDVEDIDPASYEDGHSFSYSAWPGGSSGGPVSGSAPTEHFYYNPEAAPNNPDDPNIYIFSDTKASASAYSYFYCPWDSVHVSSGAHYTQTDSIDP